MIPNGGRASARPRNLKLAGLKSGLHLLLVWLLLFACAPKPSSPSPRVIFVGLDGADWQLLDRYMADGTMPNLAALVRDGEHGTLRTQDPPLSPLVWTTMMTGVSPLEHRILDFSRFNPITRAKEPITSDERAVPAIWNMASAKGKKVDVFGMWATYPAETINGTMASDRVFSYQYVDDAPPSGSVTPVNRGAAVRRLVQQTASTVGYDAIRAYVPSLIPAEWDAMSHDPNPFAHPETALRRIIIETRVMHSLALAEASRDRPDLTIVYFEGTDAIGHLFAPYAPPKLPSVSDADYARYHDVVRRYFAAIDSDLGDDRRLAQSLDADLVIASDHGFEWGEHRAPLPALAPGTAAKAHREEGIYVRWSPAHRPPPARRVTSVADICPLLLDMLGLPDDVRAYRRGYHRATAVAPAAAASEEIAKLKALGYIGDGDAAPQGTSTRTAASFDNEALLLAAAHRDDEAIAAFDHALRIDPKNANAMWNLSELLHHLHRDTARADALLDAALAGHPDEPRWIVARGRYALERHDCRAARADFARATDLSPNDAVAYLSLGTAEACLGNETAAKRAFARSLSIDPNQPELRRILH